MSNNLVSMQNLETILKAVRLGVINKINAKDITADQKAILAKADLIDTTTNNNGFLADNGTYVHIDVDAINDIHTKTEVVKDLFDIDYLDSAYSETIISKLPVALSDFSTILYNDSIYIIGGTDGTNVQKTIYIYNTTNSTWVTGANMTTARKSFGCVQYNGKIYCIGGTDGTSNFNIVEVYDIATNTWTTLTKPLPNAKGGFRSVLYNGKIYCLGSGTSKTLDIYDIVNDVWTSGTAYDAFITSYRTEVYNDKIYMIGGYNVTNSIAVASVLIYNPVTNTWTTGTTCSTARYNHGSAIFQGKLYITGGKDNSGNVLSTTEVYDLTAGTWAAGTGLVTAKCGFGTVADSKGRVYCIGGFSATMLDSIDIIHLPFTYYVLNLPQDLQDKLNLIIDNGDGTKVLADNGQFIDIPLGYRFMTDIEVTTMVSNINSYTGA